MTQREINILCAVLHCGNSVNPGEDLNVSIQLNAVLTEAELRELTPQQVFALVEQRAREVCAFFFESLTKKFAGCL